MVQLRYPVVLASASPRRRELLGRLLAQFEVQAALVDEEGLTTADPWETAERLAVAKAAAVFARRKDALVIAGDTVVALEEGGAWRQLAKPVDVADAAKMLRALSGRTHTVVTGVAFVWPGGERAFAEESLVTFRPVGEREIARYVATGSPMDKAGAYGLQDESQDFIESVEGSVSNVVGLPIERLEQELRHFA